jgi:hypothetical protein
VTNRIALALALIVLAVIAADFYVQDGEGLLVASRMFLDLLDWVAFWR